MTLWKKIVNILTIDPTLKKIRWIDEQALSRNENSVPQLIELLKESDDSIVAAAADAIGHIGLVASEAWMELVWVLFNKHPSWVYDTVVYALKTVGKNNDVVLEILKMIKDSGDQDVSYYASLALDAFEKQDVLKK